MRVAAVNIRLDTYMHHLSEPARRMWRDRLMANIDQLNVFALGGCVCVYTFESTTFAVCVLIFPSIAVDLARSNGLTLANAPCMPRWPHPFLSFSSSSNLPLLSLLFIGAGGVLVVATKLFCAYLWPTKVPPYYAYSTLDNVG